MDRFKEFFNFDNVGRKIKNFTKWACWISIIVIWVAVGVCIIVSMTDEPYGLGIGAIVGGGILTFTTWIGSWTMYGFGEIVENTTSEKNPIGTICDANEKDKVSFLNKKETEGPSSEDAPDSEEKQEAQNTNLCDIRGICDICATKNVELFKCKSSDGTRRTVCSYCMERYGYKKE